MSKKYINMYVADKSDRFIGQLENIFFEKRELGINVIGSSVTYRHCVEDIKSVSMADVIMVSAILPDRKGIELIEYLKKNVNPKAKYIATLTTNTRNLGDEAFRAGADYVLQKPFSPQKLIDVIYELVGINEADLEEEKENDWEDEEDEEDGFVRDEEKENDIGKIFSPASEEEEETGDDLLNYDALIKEKTEVKPRKTRDMFGGINIGAFQGRAALSNKPNRVVTFTSPKSSGKTTILVNTAAAIKENSEYDPDIIIVDLNIVFPSVQFFLHHDDLKQTNKKTIYDLMDDIYELDRDLLKQAVVVHEPTGIHILDTPFQSIRDFTKVTKEKLKQLILFLREEYDLVLIDTSGNIRDDTTTTALALSDLNVILFQSDFTSLVQTRKFIEMIQLFEKHIDRRILKNTILVLNRYEHNNNLSIERVKTSIFDFENIDIQIPLYIPEEPNLTKYANKGEFIIKKQCETSEKIIELGSLVYPYYIDGNKNKKKKPNLGKKGDSLFGSLLNKWKR